MNVKLLCALILLSTVRATCANAGDTPGAPGYQIAVYYWPSWHADPDRDKKLGKGWTEWELLKSAKPQFSGHEQPRVPLWGYRDESDPKEMARTIDAMADNCVTTVLFDWYRFDDGAVLDGALRRGFLRARNRERLQFALMWANEDFEDLYPVKSGPARVWHRGPVTRKTFDRLVKEAVRDFFSKPNYWRVEGKPYFSIYDLQALVTGLGGVEQTRDALEHFRSRARAAGLPGVHINVIGWSRVASVLLTVQGKHVMEGSASRNLSSTADLLNFLNVDSVTWYSWAHVAIPPKATTETYHHWAERSTALWSKWREDVGIPFYLHVSLGWDGSPRNYPTGIVVDTSPAEFLGALEQAKYHLDQQPREGRVLTINSWNEWTEGSYLEPDTKWGLGYLEAIRKVFGSASGCTP